MTERTPHDLAFDPATVADTLGAPMVERFHQAYGRGFRYALGIEGYDDPRADLEIYPAAEVVRYSSQTSSIAVRLRDRQPYVTDECVVFEGRTDTEQSSLVFMRDGSVTFFQGPASPKSATQIEWENATRDVRACSNRVEQVADEIAASRENASSDPNGEQDKTRVKIEGRMGTDPRIRATNRGIIVRFPLAEHAEDNHTVWHEVYSTKDFGARQRHPVKGENGELQTKDVIYAYAVKRLHEPNGG
jgi:hypothetical protein